MAGVKEFLQGKKTYIVAIVAGLIEASKYIEAVNISPDLEKLIWTILAGLGVSAVRAGINKAK